MRALPASRLLQGGLPMYALPELAPTTAAWWRALARHLKRAGVASLPEKGVPEEGVPEATGSSADLEGLWLSPRLLLAQTCGYPLTHGLAGRVRYLATLCYGAPGCRGAVYRSLIVVRAKDPAGSLADLRGRRAAINGWDSHSGMNALRHAVAPLAKEGRFFREVLVSGSHRNSLAKLCEGEADVAAVDCVTFALLQQEAPAEVLSLRTLAVSAAAPGLPLITRSNAPKEEVAALRRGLTAAFADPELEPLRRRLLLTGVEVLSEDAYGRILDMEQEAAAEGYAALA